jgi:hypothetical protein
MHYGNACSLDLAYLPGRLFAAVLSVVLNSLSVPHKQHGAYPAQDQTVNDV